jgi:branched-chain amino acid transport system ATP-binding protein
VEASESAIGLVVRDATVRFGGITALDGVSLEVGGGEVVGVIGPNGAGKTTLFNLICGFVAPDSGTLRWRGQSLARISPDRLAGLGIARTLQGVGLFERLSVLENVMIGAERFRRARLGSALFGLPASDASERALGERAQAALAQVGCEDVGDRLPGSLPYAVQKRVALARALVAEPELLLLDEPAGGLDTGELEELTSLIRSVADTIAVMLVDHHMDLVTNVCDRMVVLDLGRVIASGVPPEVRQNPQVLEAYLGRDAGDPVATAEPEAADAGD